MDRKANSILSIAVVCFSMLSAVWSLSSNFPLQPSSPPRVSPYAAWLYYLPFIACLPADRLIADLPLIPLLASLLIRLVVLAALLLVSLLPLPYAPVC